MTDAETSAAIDALAHRLRLRDEAMRDADADVFAAEAVTALRGYGWRPTPAKVYPAPKPAPAGLSARLKPETTELLRDLHADMDARAEAARAAKEGAA